MSEMEVLRKIVNDRHVGGLYNTAHRKAAKWAIATIERQNKEIARSLLQSDNAEPQKCPLVTPWFARPDYLHEFGGF